MLRLITKKMKKIISSDTLQQSEIIKLEKRNILMKMATFVTVSHKQKYLILKVKQTITHMSIAPEGWTHFVITLKKSDVLNESETTKYMACCFDPEDYYEEISYIDEDGELSCNSSCAKLFNTEDEAIEYADENKPIDWVSFAIPF